MRKENEWQNDLELEALDSRSSLFTSGIGHPGHELYEPVSFSI